MSNPQKLGILIQVDASQLPKLQEALKQQGVEFKQMGDAAQQSGRAIEEHSARQTSLHEVLGTSRRESVFLEQSLLNLAGSAGVATHGIEALMTGIGPIGLVVTAASLAIGLINERMKEEQKATEEATAALAKFVEQQNKLGSDFARFAPNIVEAAQAEQKHTQAIKEAEAAIVPLEARLKEETANVNDLQAALNAGSPAAMALKHAQDELADTTDLYNKAVRDLKDLIQGLPSDFGGAGGALLEFTADTDRGRESTGLLNEQLRTEAELLDYIAKSQGPKGLSQQMSEALTQAKEMDRLGAEGRFRNSSVETARTWKEISNNIEEAKRKAEEAGRKAQSDAKRLAEEQQRLTQQMQDTSLRLFDELAKNQGKVDDKIRKSFADTMANMVVDQARAQGKMIPNILMLQAEFEGAFKGMSATAIENLLAVMATGDETSKALIAQFLQTALAAGTTAAAVNDINAAINGLPTSKTIDITLLINTMFGGGGGGPGGHQQGNEWNFTFEGEDPATRSRFLAANNNNVEDARRQWYQQHAAELENKGVPKPPDYQSPYTPAGTPGMAEGGPVQPGHVYTVGEHGKEAFVPAAAGTIIPHGILDALPAMQGAYSTPYGSGVMGVHASTIAQHHYNLTIVTSAQHEPIVRDFHMMRAMAVT